MTDDAVPLKGRFNETDDGGSPKPSTPALDADIKPHERDWMLTHYPWGETFAELTFHVAAGMLSDLTLQTRVPLRFPPGHPTVSVVLERNTFSEMAARACMPTTVPAAMSSSPATLSENDDDEPLLFVPPPVSPSPTSSPGSSPGTSPILRAKTTVTRLRAPAPPATAPVGPKSPSTMSGIPWEGAGDRIDWLARPGF